MDLGDARIVAVSYFRWHGKDGTTDCLEEENMQEFLSMRRMMRT